MQDDPDRDCLYEADDDALEQRRSHLWMSHGVALFVILVALFNPQSLERWAAANPPSWAVETVRLTVGTWSDRMQLIGLEQPRQQIEQGWQELKSADWDDLETRGVQPDEGAP